MKKLIVLIIVIITLISIKNVDAFMLKKQKSSLVSDIEGFREPTNEEMNYMRAKGWLTEDDEPDYIKTCSWADGLGGGMDCPGGICFVVVRNDGYSAQIICNQGGTLTNCCLRVL